MPRIVRGYYDKLYKYPTNPAKSLTEGMALTLTLHWSFTINGEFPNGALMVVFQDHNYTPTKSDNDVGGVPIGFTWH